MPSAFAMLTKRKFSQRYSGDGKKMKVPIFVVLLISATLAALSKQDEFLDAVHTSTRGNSKYKIIEELLKNPEVDPSVNDNEPFLYAVSHDDFFVAQLLLNNERVNPGAQNGAAILSAVSRSNYSILVLLLNCNRVDPAVKGHSVIGTAILKEDTIMMQIILDSPRFNLTEKLAYGILTFAARKFTGNGEPLALLMKHHKFAERLVKKLFTVAVSEDRWNLLDWLLTQDSIDPTFENYAALKAAVRMGQYEMVQRLLEEPRVDAGNNRNFLLLRSIAYRDHRMMQILLNNPKLNPSDRDGTFLMEAVEVSDYFILEKLLDRMDNPSANGNIALRLALRKKDMKMIRMLLAHPNISLIVPVYQPPFLLALEGSELEIVKMFAEHPRFAESHHKQAIECGLKFAQQRNLDEIGNYLRTLNVTGNPEICSVALTKPMTQLEVRLGVLNELIFCSSVERQVLTSIQAKRELVMSKLNALLERNDLYTIGNSGSAPPSNPWYELLKLTFMDFQTYARRLSPQANMQDAFTAFVRKVNGSDPAPVANIPPADLKRKREDGKVGGSEAPTGEQEPPHASRESSSSGVPDRNVRRRMNNDDNDAEQCEDGIDNERSVEAGKEPEDV
jgi:hypothetical protein